MFKTQMTNHSASYDRIPAVLKPLSDHQCRGAISGIAGSELN
jgi:hypothetical protein